MTTLGVNPGECRQAYGNGVPEMQSNEKRLSNFSVRHPLWMVAIVCLITAPLLAPLGAQEAAPVPIPAGRQAIDDIIKEGNWAEALAMAKARLATPAWPLGCSLGGAAMCPCQIQ